MRLPLRKVLHVLGLAPIGVGGFVFFLSVAVFAARSRSNPQPIFQVEVDRYLADFEQAKQGMLIGLSFLAIGGLMFFIRARIEALQKYLANRR